MLSHSRYACDSCRRRKVKCNRTVPCTSCHDSGLECTHTRRPLKRGPRVEKWAPPIGVEQHLHDQQYDTHAGILRRDPALSRTDYAPYADAEQRHRFRLSNGDAEGTRPLHRQVLLDSPNYHQSPIPATLAGNSASAPDAPLINEQSFGAIQLQLSTKLESILALQDLHMARTVLDLVLKCTDLFFQYMFPSTPVAHRGTIRAAASLVQPDNRPDPSRNKTSASRLANISQAKSFTLITALCAFVASVMPESLLPYGQRLVDPFLRSSKAMLNLYEEYDLERPDSTSLTIRIWHSGALQNSTGRREGAWHVHSEASLLALRLRLYDEAVVRESYHIERRLLRMNFWLLYSADKAGAALGSRLSLLSEPTFDQELTLLEHTSEDAPLLDEASGLSDFEQRILCGFHLKTQTWTAGARVITEIKALLHHKEQPDSTVESNDARLLSIARANTQFNAHIRHLPIWLQHLGTSDRDEIPELQYHQSCFWVQRSNISTVYHCLKLSILQKCIENDLVEVLDLPTHPSFWSRRQMDIAQEFIDELQLVPFICFKVQGEAAVERVRHVASIMLEAIQNLTDDHLFDRMKIQFDQLLDFLTKLDSKAPSALIGE